MSLTSLARKFLMALTGLFLDEVPLEAKAILFVCALLLFMLAGRVVLRTRRSGQQQANAAQIEREGRLRRAEEVKQLLSEAPPPSGQEE